MKRHSSILTETTFKLILSRMLKHILGAVVTSSNTHRHCLATMLSFLVLAATRFSTSSAAIVLSNSALQACVNNGSQVSRLDNYVNLVKLPEVTLYILKSVGLIHDQVQTANCTGACCW